MKRIFASFTLILLCLPTYTQTPFDEGYFIDNSGQKIECLIKNADWRSNPVDLDFKLNENTEEKNLAMDSVREFGIGESIKYVRHTVLIDRSSMNTDDLSHVKEPEFQEETLFLQTLVEGEVQLYVYRSGNLKRFFYQKAGSGPEQLVYKKYQNFEVEPGLSVNTGRLNTKGNISTNMKYKKQLWDQFPCEQLTADYYGGIDYTEPDLLTFFVKYNECKGATAKQYALRKKRNLINFAIRPGFNFSSLEIDRDYDLKPEYYDFGSKTIFRLGLEIELMLPIHGDKWAIITEPTFQKYIAEEANAIIEYASLDVPLGVRYYMFLSPRSKLFVNGAVITGFYFDSIIEREGDEDLDLGPVPNFAFGLGYTFNERYMIEFRYQTSREILGNFVQWSSDYRTASVILGYSFLRVKN